MAPKEAVVCCVDVSHSMSLPDSSLGRPRYEVAMEVVQKLVTSKMMYAPRDEVGVVLVGTAETRNPLAADIEGQYQNLFMLQDLAVAGVDLARSLPNVRPVADAAVPCDVLDALVVGLDMLHRRTRNKKYNRRLMLITDGTSRVAGAGDLAQIMSQVAALECTVMVIDVDHLGAAASPVKAENMRMLADIAAQTNSRVLPVGRTLEILGEMRAKSVAQTASFRGALQLDPHTRIAVHAYPRTLEAKPPTLSKESRRSATAAEGGAVKQDRVHRRQDEPDGEVPPDMLCKAFRYGDQYIPCNDGDLAGLAYATVKELKVMGYAPADTLRRHWSLKNVELLVAEPENRTAQLGLSALVRALAAERKVAIARYVKTKTAALVALSPHASPEFEGLYIRTLPFAEDLRDYPFMNFAAEMAPAAGSAEAAAADAFVAALDLMHAGEGGAELLDPERTFNPLMQRLQQCTLARALAPDCALPDPDPAVLECVNQDAALFEAADGAVQAFAAAFPLRAAPEKKAKKRRFWSDFEADEAPAKVPRGAGAGGPSEPAAPAAPAPSIEELLATDAVTTVGTINPSDDFRALVARRDADVTASAIAGMQTVIANYLEGSNRAYWKKAVGCMQVLRDGCLANAEADSFNAFLRELKAAKAPAGAAGCWPQVQQAGISLIHQGEESDVAVTPEESAAFLASAVPAAAAPAPAAAGAGAGEDLFDDME